MDRPWLGRTASDPCEPDLTTETASSQAKPAESAQHYLSRESKLRFGSCECGQLFTWPTDQPRHATIASDIPVETSTPPSSVNLYAT
jgi:hypothetical protein